MITEVIFDLETKKLFSDIEDMDPSKLGVSVVSLYTRELDQNMQEVSGQMQSFWENEFDKMWPLFSRAERIIGFNSIRFDVPALSPHSPAYFSKLPHFDILQEIKRVHGRRTSLDSIAKECLKTYKSDVGTNAVVYWHKGDPVSLAKLKSYCEDDVIITRDVYDFVLKNKMLRFKDHWNTLREVELDFSYPEKKNDTGQIGLF